MLACSLFIGILSHAQQASNYALTWDVVSVRESKSDDAHDVSNKTDDSVTIKNLLLQYIIQTVYDYRRPNYVFGIPDWAKNAKYDITAKVAPEDQARFSKLSEQEKFAMLKIVLSERFHLQAHLEMREFPTYSLTVAKGGPKMKTATPDNTYANGLKDNGIPVGSNQIRWTGWDEVRGQAVPMSSLATVLSGTPRVGLGRPVIDQTKTFRTLRFHPPIQTGTRPKHE